MGGDSLHSGGKKASIAFFFLVEFSIEILDCLIDIMVTCLGVGRKWCLFVSEDFGWALCLGGYF